MPSTIRYQARLRREYRRWFRARGRAALWSLVGLDMLKGGVLWLVNPSLDTLTWVLTLLAGTILFVIYAAFSLLRLPAVVARRDWHLLRTYRDRWHGCTRLPDVAPELQEKMNFLKEQFAGWIAKLREAQARQDERLFQERRKKITALIERALGAEAKARFHRAFEENERPGCAWRLDRNAFDGNDLEYMIEVFILALESLRDRLEPEAIEPEWRPWRLDDPTINP